MAEIAGLVTYSFGEEDVDRHIQVRRVVEIIIVNVLFVDLEEGVQSV